MPRIAGVSLTDTDGLSFLWTWRPILSFCLYEHLLAFPEFHRSLVKNKYQKKKPFLIYIWEQLISFKKMVSVKSFHKVFMLLKEKEFAFTKP